MTDDAPREKSPCQPDDELIALIRGGQTKLFAALFDRHVSRVIGYALVLTNSREDAKDIAQEVFIRVFKGLQQYRPEGHFVSWLLTITRRLVIDEKRKRKAPVAPLEENSREGSALAAVKVDAEAASSRKLEFLSFLPPLEKEILLLRFVEDCPYEEIAGIVQMQEGSVRNAVCRALQRLREEFTEREL